MKMVELKNVREERISIRQVRGLALDPGESKKVPPATAAHPAVKRYIGNGLVLVDPSKEEPKAPAPPAPAPPKPEPAPEPKPEPEPAADSEPKEESKEEPKPEPEGETAGKDLREEYISAPGITETNVKAILKAYPTFEKLAAAAKNDLSDLGVAPSYTKRLKIWAKEQLSS